MYTYLRHDERLSFVALDCSSFEAKKPNNHFAYFIVAFLREAKTKRFV